MRISCDDPILGILAVPFVFPVAYGLGVGMVRLLGSASEGYEASVEKNVRHLGAMLITSVGATALLYIAACSPTVKRHFVPIAGACAAAMVAFYGSK